MLKEVFPMAVGPTMVIRYFIFYSPDGNGNPAVVKVSFSWCKRATNGSSFYALEKQLEQRGVAVYSWKWLLIILMLADVHNDNKILHLDYDWELHNFHTIVFRVLFCCYLFLQFRQLQFLWERR